MVEPAGRKTPDAAVGWFFASKTARDALMMGGFVCAHAFFEFSRGESFVRIEE